MRHRLAGRNLSRTSSHRKALRRSLCQALFQFGRIRTTVIKAKEVQPMAEKLITIARRGDLASRRRVIQLMGDRSLATEADPDSNDTVVRKLFREVAPRFADRPGGYTRIVKLSDTRVGDGSQLAFLELVSEESEHRKAPKSRRKRTGAARPKDTAAPKETVVEEADQQIETNPAEPEAQPESEAKDETV
jgi:large subunit ribosomal protein L17